MRLRYQAISDVGLVRKNNQDSGYASPTTLVVADGMGGAAAGDLASRLAIMEFSKSDTLISGTEMLDSLSDSLTQINVEIRKQYTANQENYGMGTTVTGLKFDGEKYGLVNIGDSRTYLIRDGEISRLSHDHSFVQELIDQGQITEAEAHTHPNRSWILKVLNGTNTFEPDLSLISAQLGDRLVICSDGLCGLVSDEEILEIASAENWESISDNLVKAALAAGGQDNITVVLAEVVADDKAVETTPLIVGAAANSEEEISEKTTEIPIVRPDPQNEEITRYQPRVKKFGSLIPILIGITATALVIVAGIFGAKFYIAANSHYFLAPEHGEKGKIVVWYGIPDMNWVNSIVASPNPEVLMEEVLKSDREKLLSYNRIKVNDIDVGLHELHQMRNNWQKCMASKKAHTSSSDTLKSGSNNISNTNPTARPNTDLVTPNSSVAPTLRPDNTPIPSQNTTPANPPGYLPGEC